MSPQHSIELSQKSNRDRIAVVDEQIAVLVEHRHSLEQIGHKLIDAMISYNTREHIAQLPFQRPPSD